MYLGTYYVYASTDTFPHPLIGVLSPLSEPPTPTLEFPSSTSSLTHSLTTLHPDNEINTYSPQPPPIHHRNRKTHPPWLSASISSPSSRDVPRPRPRRAGRPSHFHLRQRGALQPQDRGHYEDGRCCGAVAAREPGRWLVRGGHRLGLSRARRWRRVLLGGRRGQGRGWIGGWVSFFALDDQPQPNKTNNRFPRASPHLPPRRSAYVTFVFFH